MDAAHHDRAVSDPAGLITDLVTAKEHQLGRDQVHAVVAAAAGGRAKSRRLALALAGRPAVLADGRSPAPRAVANLLVALHDAGARDIPLPACAQCGRQVRGFQRRGQDWYCTPCTRRGEPCAACGKDRPVSSRDRAGRPRCAKCPDDDGRDPVTVIHGIITTLDPGAGRETVAGVVRQAAPRPSYQQKLAWALEENPALLTGDGHLAPLRAIPRFIEMLHDAGVAGVVRPACGRCGRVVRIDKPLDGVRVCRTCIAHSRTEPCARCGAIREPVTRDGQGGRSARTASSSLRRTWRPAPAAAGSAGSSGEPRTGRFAPGALPFRSWPARSADRRCLAGSPGQPGCHGARPASAGGPRAQPADAMSRSPPAR